MTPLASPCINICRMDEASGWCEGCLRTLDEIAAWGGLDEPAKHAVLLATSARRPRWRERKRAANRPPDDAAEALKA